MKTNINIIGLGFVGLTTALGFASKKNKIICVEKNPSRLNSIKKGKVPFKEPDLEKVLKKTKKNFCIFSEKPIILKSAVNIVFICVGTPCKSNGAVNLDQINKTIISIKNNHKNERIIFVIKSTVPPGTIKENLKNFKNRNISFCSNPEFLREGFAWYDFNNTDKIVIGYERYEDFKILKKIYNKFKGDIIGVNTNTSEFIKYLSNSLLASLISFSNELTMLAEKQGDINVREAFDAVKLDKRWFGNPATISNYLHPGLGYGGYCLPKDLMALNFLAKKNKILNGILESTNSVNNKITRFQTKKLFRKFSKNNQIAILGLSFKPNSDDLRGSKSVELINVLLKKGYKKIYTYDPLVGKEIKKIFGKKVNHSKKLKFDPQKKYILCTAWKDYINFVRKLDKQNYLDFRYVI